MVKITESTMNQFRIWLREREKSDATIQKYMGAVERFALYLGENEADKEQLLKYREKLQGSRSARTVNGHLAAIHAYLDFCGMSDCRVKLLKVQRNAFADERRELSREDYEQLVETAKRRGKKRLYLMCLALCGTGIRVSELRYITLEAVRRGMLRISLKGKNRTVILPEKLRKLLLQYAKEKRITDGPIFRTRSGRPVDRSNVCHEMKKLSEEAGVDQRKVFPHNLRHLFARTFYRVKKNLACLADILGHSSMETTRIYVAESASVYRNVINQMSLII